MIWYLITLILFTRSISARYVLSTNPSESPDHDKVRAVWSYHYDKYLTFPEMEQRLHLLSQTYPELLSLKVVGKSLEKRNIYLVTVTSNLHRDQATEAVPEKEINKMESSDKDARNERRMPINFDSEVDKEKILRVSGIKAENRYNRSRLTGPKPVIFVDGGIHAREWASPAAALYIIDQIIKDPSLTGPIEWRIMPMINPDGYVYTGESRTKRFWRKNRRVTSQFGCWGVDLNRNFDVSWRSTVKNPCSIVFGGTSAFSEPESRALRDQINGLQGRVKAYVTIHSYGQYILYPYGYSNSHQPENLDELKAMANGMAQEIFDSYRSNYKVGSASILGAAAGGSDDWAYMKGKVPYTFLIEMRPKSGSGLGGFDLPASDLQQAVDEVWRATSYLARNIKLQYRTNELRSDLAFAEKILDAEKADKPSNLETYQNQEPMPAESTRKETVALIPEQNKQPILVSEPAKNSHSDDLPTIPALEEDNSEDIISEIKPLVVSEHESSMSSVPDKQSAMKDSTDKSSNNVKDSLTKDSNKELNSVKEKNAEIMSIKEIPSNIAYNEQETGEDALANDDNPSYTLSKETISTTNLQKDGSASSDSLINGYTKDDSKTGDSSSITSEDEIEPEKNKETGSKIVSEIGNLAIISSEPENNPVLILEKENSPIISSEKHSIGVSLNKESITPKEKSNPEIYSSKENVNNDVSVKKVSLVIGTDTENTPTIVSQQEDSKKIVSQKDKSHPTIPTKDIDSTDVVKEIKPALISEKEIKPITNSEEQDSITPSIDKGSSSIIVSEKEHGQKMVSEKEVQPFLTSEEDNAPTYIVETKSNAIPTLEKDNIPISDLEKENSEKNALSKKGSNTVISKEENKPIIDSRKENVFLPVSLNENDLPVVADKDIYPTTDSENEHSEKLVSEVNNSKITEVKNITPALVPDKENIPKIVSEKESSPSIDSKVTSNSKMDSEKETSLTIDSKEETSKLVAEESQISSIIIINSVKTDSDKESNSNSYSTRQESLPDSVINLSPLSDSQVGQHNHDKVDSNKKPDVKPAYKEENDAAVNTNNKVNKVPTAENELEDIVITDKNPIYDGSEKTVKKKISKISPQLESDQQQKVESVSIIDQNKEALTKEKISEGIESMEQETNHKETSLHEVNNNPTLESFQEMPDNLESIMPINIPQTQSRENIAPVMDITDDVTAKVTRIESVEQTLNKENLEVDQKDHSTEDDSLKRQDASKDEQISEPMIDSKVSTGETKPLLDDRTANLNGEKVMNTLDKLRDDISITYTTNNNDKKEEIESKDSVVKLIENSNKNFAVSNQAKREDTETDKNVADENSVKENDFLSVLPKESELPIATDKEINSATDSKKESNKKLISDKISHKITTVKEITPLIELDKENVPMIISGKGSSSSTSSKVPSNHEIAPAKEINPIIESEEENNPINDAVLTASSTHYSDDERILNSHSTRQESLLDSTINLSPSEKHYQDDSNKEDEVKPTYNEENAVAINTNNKADELPTAEDKQEDIIISDIEHVYDDSEKTVKNENNKSNPELETDQQQKVESDSITEQNEEVRGKTSESMQVMEKESNVKNTNLLEVNNDPLLENLQEMPDNLEIIEPINIPQTQLGENTAPVIGITDDVETKDTPSESVEQTLNKDSLEVAQENHITEDDSLKTDDASNKEPINKPMTDSTLSTGETKPLLDDKTVDLNSERDVDALDKLRDDILITHATNSNDKKEENEAKDSVVKLVENSNKNIVALTPTKIDKLENDKQVVEENPQIVKIAVKEEKVVEVIPQGKVDPGSESNNKITTLKKEPQSDEQLTVEHSEKMSPFQVLDGKVNLRVIPSESKTSDGENQVVGLKELIKDKSESADNKNSNEASKENEHISSETEKAKVTDDKVVNDKEINDKVINDKLVNDKLVNDKVVNDKVGNDKIVYDKVVNDKVVNDKVVNDKVDNDKVVIDKVLNDKVVNDKEVNIMVDNTGDESDISGSKTETFDNKQEVATVGLKSPDTKVTRIIGEKKPLPDDSASTDHGMTSKTKTEVLNNKEDFPYLKTDDLLELEGIYNSDKRILNSEMAFPDLKLQRTDETFAFNSPDNEGIPLSIWCRRIKNIDMCPQL